MGVHEDSRPLASSTSGSQGAMTTADIVALAKKTAHAYEGKWLTLGTIIVVLDTGLYWNAGANLKKRSNEIMRAKIGIALAAPGSQPSGNISPGLRFNGVAFEEALTRALLRSAVTVERSEVETSRSQRLWNAYLHRNVYGVIAYGATETEARDALLDALLAPTEGR